MINSSYHQQVRETYRYHHYQQQQLLQQEHNMTEVSGVKSTMTSCDVTDDEMKHGRQSSPSDIISSLQHHSSSASESALCRPVYIHRPFEDVPVPLQVNDARRFVVDKQGRMQSVVEQPRHGHHQLWSTDGGRRESWQSATVGSDEVCSSDDDVDGDVNVLGDKTNDSQRQHHDFTVYSGDTTRSESHHYQPQHGRKPGYSHHTQFL